LLVEISNLVKSKESKYVIFDDFIERVMKIKDINDIEKIRDDEYYQILLRRLTGIEIQEGELDYSESDLLGKGGQGAVYKGKYKGEEVAIKISFGSTNDREISSINALYDFPNIVDIKGICNSKEKGQIIVMKKYKSFNVESEPGLIEAFKKKEGVKEKLIRIADLLMASTFMINSSIFFRDYKFDNTLQTEDGRLVITDFGGAIATLENDETKTLSQIYTDLYRADDYNTKFNVRNDVYAIGIMLTELLKGKLAKTFFKIGTKDQIDKGRRKVIPEYIEEEKSEDIFKGYGSEEKRMKTTLDKYLKEYKKTIVDCMKDVSDRDSNCLYALLQKTIELLDDKYEYKYKENVEMNKHFKQDTKQYIMENILKLSDSNENTEIVSNVPFLLNPKDKDNIIKTPPDEISDENLFTLLNSLVISYLPAGGEEKLYKLLHLLNLLKAINSESGEDGNKVITKRIKTIETNLIETMKIKFKIEY